MKSAVSLLLPAEPGLFWAVSRRNDTTQWGLPGGKVDPGESAQDAVIRETFEEVGLVISDKTALIPLYSAVCPGKGPEDTYWVTTYLLTQAVDPTSLVAEDGLVVRAMDERALTSIRSCPFAHYNVGAFNAWREYNGQAI